MHQPSTQKIDCALYVVATPIGNMRDITLRALDILQQADVIAAEDTRNTAHLLQHHHIASQKLLAVHQHNERGSADKIIALLEQGRSVALVTDAGTPAISDPGALVVQAVRAAGWRIIPIPGACASIAALSAAGLPNPQFLFYGFLPNKSNARRNELTALREHSCNLVFYEAPHRILECVQDLCDILGGERQLVLARELTKLFETLHSCPLQQAHEWLSADSNQQRGEFVVIVSGYQKPPGISANAQHTLTLLLDNLPVKQAVQLTTQLTGANRNELYQLALKIKQAE